MTGEGQEQVLNMGQKGLGNYKLNMDQKGLGYLKIDMDQKGLGKNIEY